MGDFVSKNKKIGIITLNGYFNYGNRLQNYATEYILESLGFEVETIINTTKKEVVHKRSLLEKVYEMGLYNIVIKIKDKIWSYINKDKIEKYEGIKRKKFKKFSKEYLNESHYEISINNIPHDINLKYDYFITGSDQVWNPTFPDTSEVNFLTFANKEKRIALAPSFGISNLPNQFKENYKSWINGIKMLSVREYAGADIIKNLTGRSAEVLVDPTMVLDKNHWESICKESKVKPQSKYIFTYILGDLSNKRKKFINDIAKENSLEVVNITDIKQLNTYATGPREFIDFLNSSNLVITDSFHASVFSLIFEKPLIVMDRKDDNLAMSSRIDTLFKKFNIPSRYYQDLNTSKIFESYNIDKCLKQEQNRFYDYISESLRKNR